MKRSSAPVAAAAEEADGVNVSRKMARVHAAGHGIFDAPDEAPQSVTSWAPRADAFLTDFLNSPKKGQAQTRKVTVSEVRRRASVVDRRPAFGGRALAVARMCFWPRVVRLLRRHSHRLTA